MAAAITFAVTLVPVPVPVAGMSSHLCATPVLGLLLGRSALLVPATVVLAAQALLFAHGGLTTLGVNALTLGLVGPAVAAGALTLLGWARLRGPLAVFLACALGHVAVYAVDAVALAAALAREQPFAHWLSVVGLGLAPVQLPLALLEGAASALLVGALARRRPGLVPARLQRAPAAPRGVAPPLLLLALGLLSAGPAAGELPGADDVVLAGAARAAGRAASAPAAGRSEEEVGRGTFLLGGLAAGIVLGRGWARLRSSSREGPRAR
jgi:cobalt/nickel transport system permease protein